jgi:hypothetical protein
MAKHMHSEEVDLVIVGAGPHALTLLARLVEEEPSDLYDQELRQYNKKRFGRKENAQQRRERLLSRIVVIDPSGVWLSQWNENFDQLQIEHLRSPVNIHPDPQDAMALREFAELRQKHRMMQHFGKQTTSTATQNVKSARFSELVPTGVLDGKQHWMDKASKKKRSQMFFFSEAQRELLLLPTSKLFSEFTESVVSRYQLQDKVTPGKVLSIDPHFALEANDGTDLNVEYFDVKWSEADGCKFGGLGTVHNIKTKSVVVAVGGGNMAQVPNWAAKAINRGLGPANTILHSHQLAKLHRLQDREGSEQQSEPSVYTTSCSQSAPSCPRLIAGVENLPGTNALTRFFNQKRVLIVGGGLSASHVALLALRKCGAKCVTTAARRKRTIKQYDAELGWVSRTSLSEMHNFWSEEDPAKRLNIAKQARGGGGTITPQVDSELNKLERSGKGYTRLEGVEVHDAQWTPVCTEHGAGFAGGANDGSANDGGARSVGQWRVQLTGGHKPLDVDCIILATGSLLDVHKEPLFKGIMSKLPVPMVSGLPVLGNDKMPGSCQWGEGCYGEDCRLYVMGGYATLSLGPMAGNLVGALVGARLVANSLDGFVGRSSEVSVGLENDDTTIERYYSKVGSSFAALEYEEGTSSEEEDDGFS